MVHRPRNTVLQLCIDRSAMQSSIAAEVVTDHKYLVCIGVAAERKSRCGGNSPKSYHFIHPLKDPPRLSAPLSPLNNASLTVAALPTPATHAYLGEATTGSTLSRKDLEVGSTVEMPILSLPGVVLFPGESLPLRLHNAHATLAQSMLAGEAGWTHGGQGQASRHLGVVNRLTSRSGG